MKYAVIRTGGKQYKVAEGDIIEVEKLSSLEQNQQVIYSEILLYNNEGKINIGHPFVSGVVVNAVLLDHIKGEKIRVAKYKAKVRYRRVTGHRQHLSRIKIESIELPVNKQTEKAGIGKTAITKKTVRKVKTTA